MTRAARRGIQGMTGRPPREDDVDSAVHDAFIEFLDKDPGPITTPIGLAYQVAFRRGQDMGRSLNRRKEFPNSEVVDGDEKAGGMRLLIGAPASPEDEVMEAERAADQERWAALARQCVEELPTGQMEVLTATILDQQSLSDWAVEKEKSYQAADQQRNRALKTLERCVKEKLAKGGGHAR